MNRTMTLVAVAAALPCALAAQPTGRPPQELPERATAALRASLDAAGRHPRHVWRDTPSMNEDGTVNAYVEIPRGDRRKWEFDMRANARALDRVLPAAIGGYPINYGFVPQTVSYDGDPFDALVLGPPLPGGRVVRGVAAGLLLMADEKGLDSKVVLAPVGPDGRPREALDAGARARVAEYFRGYKRHEPGAFSQVPGWGSAADGLAHVRMTHAFFRQCRARPGACRIAD